MDRLSSAHSLDRSTHLLRSFRQRDGACLPQLCQLPDRLVSLVFRLRPGRYVHMRSLCGVGYVNPFYTE